MDAAGDVTPSALSTLLTARPDALTRALADCPTPLLWAALRQVLPPTEAAKVFDAAAATAVRPARE